VALAEFLVTPCTVPTHCVAFPGNHLGPALLAARAVGLTAWRG